MYDTAVGSFMVWTHHSPGASHESTDSAVLGAAVVIPTLASLAQAAPALQTLSDKQGTHILLQQQQPRVTKYTAQAIEMMQHRNVDAWQQRCQPHGILASLMMHA